MKSLRLWVIALAIVLAFGATMPVFAQQTGQVCLDDVYDNPFCVANDVRIISVTPVEVLKPCYTEPVGEVTVVVEVLVQAGPDVDDFDIGLYFDLSGSASGALDGDNCLHDYLEPPLTTSPTFGDYNSDGIQDIYLGPFLDSDSDLCGDIPKDSQIIKNVTMTLPCVDNTGDPLGAADIHVCTSWRPQPNTACNSLAEAIPGAGCKCRCDSLEFNFDPNATDITTIKAQPRYGVIAAASVAGLGLAAGGVAIVLQRRKKDKDQAVETPEG